MFQKFINDDCIDIMRRMPDKYFDLAIVDPPYFSGPNKRKSYGAKESQYGVEKKIYPTIKDWEVPNAQYFFELVRISKNQIVFGINYFAKEALPALSGSGRIVWDKVNGKSSFSDCEIAYCSLHDSVRLFAYMWNGMFQGKSIDEGRIQQGNKKLNEKRIHPTQKPVNLYLWLLQTYAKEGDLIFDSHVGSASSLIACERLGFDYIGVEKDEVIYQMAKERLKDERSKL